MADGDTQTFHLPAEILSLLPSDPHAQLDLARKITSLAISSRVSKLDGEAEDLRRRLEERENVVVELQREVARLEVVAREADGRVRAAEEENVKLTKERDALGVTAMNLKRDLTKLEKFKKQLMLSLSEDNSSVTHPSESADVVTYEQNGSQHSSMKDDGPIGYTSTNTVTGSAGSQSSGQEGHPPQKFWPTPYITPRFTPSATPKLMSSNVSPRGASAVGSPKMSGPPSPTKSRIEGKVVSTPWYSSSQKSSAANSPPRGCRVTGRPPRIDGKEFFRQARNRLSYEQFGAFLANIKELNAHKQSREETLRKAKEIFGTDNKDLYLSFYGLLNRHLS